MADPVLQLSDRSVDLEAHEIRLRGETTTLTKNEVALLRHLLAQAGAAVSREELHREVFGYAPQVVSRAADYAVHRLRRKLEADPSEPAHLLTVAGVGFRLVLDAAPDPHPATAPPAPRHNLPADTTSFLFREDDLAAVLALFEGGARLVTVVGPAGVGKTRLSRRAGAAWFDRHREAVSFCDLSTVTDAPGLFGAVADALAHPDPLGSKPADRLADVLTPRTLLLVLDNVEQIVAPVAAVAQRWLEAAPGLRLLLTSRERVRAPAEHTHELAPLDDPQGAELFVERARMAHAAFRVDGEQGWATLRQLARQLDGLPLAIELAAARSAVLSPRQMLDRLALTHQLGPAPVGVPDRQASLDQAFAWSWELLTANERSALAQLTAFRGDFDVDDAEAVVALGASAEPVVSVVQALRDKSLLLDASAGGAPRFAMLRAVREFAGAQHADVSGLWRRHAAWVLSRTAEPARRLLLGDPGGTPILERDAANLAIAVQRLSRQEDDHALFARAVTAAHATWLRSGTFDDYLAHVASALERSADLAVHDRVGLHLARALFCQPRGGGELAERSARAVLELMGADAPCAESAAAWLLLASYDHAAKRLDDARAALDRAHALLAPLPVGALHVKLEVQSGNTRLEQHRFADADRHYRRGLAQAERAGATSFEPLLYLNLAVLRGWEHKGREQVAMARRALMSARAQRQRVRERRALLMLCVAQSEVGALDDAARHGADAVTLSEADHDASLACDAPVALAGVEFARGHLEAVGRHVRDARRVEAHVRAPAHRAYIDLWDALACWARWGSLEDAATLLERAAGHAAGQLPHGELLIASKQLALRAHGAPAAAAARAAASAQLEDRARALGRDDLARAFAIDRAHVALAGARRAIDRGDSPEALLAPVLDALRGGGVAAIAHDGMAATWSRVLLASAYAELEHGVATPVAGTVPGAR